MPRRARLRRVAVGRTVARVGVRVAHVAIGAPRRARLEYGGGPRQKPRRVAVGRVWGTSTLGGACTTPQVWSDDVVGELGVGGHTVERGWAWPGAVNQEILANDREVRQSRGFSSTEKAFEKNA